MKLRRVAVICALFTLACEPLLRAQGLPANPPADNLDMRYADGIVAIVENKIITVDDVRKVISPLIPALRQESRNEKEFDDKLQSLQDDVIQNLIDQQLMIKAFYKPVDGDAKNVRHVPASIIDNQISEQLITQFDGDRSKFLNYLRTQGMTLNDYRKKVEDDIIVQYMEQQQRKSRGIVSPVKVETYYKENKDRFYQEDAALVRVIQFARSAGETDSQLRAKADAVLAKFHDGEPFAELARQYGQDPRRSTGGDWGWIKRSDMRKEFTDILFSLKKGQVSPPIIVHEGCFLLYVEDRRYAGIQPLDQVRDQIERILAQQMTRQSQQRWLERLRRNAYVKLF